MKNTLDILQKLISFKTTAENSQEIQRGFEYIASLFPAEIFDVQLIEKNGKYSLLVSKKKGNIMRPAILLNGHFDVVAAADDSQFVLKIEGDKALGRGTVDMKGMVAVLIEVMREVASLPLDVALLLNGDEEVGGENGAGYLAKEWGLLPGFVLCADGPHEDEFKITTKEKGGVWLELKARGKDAHGAYPWLGENALDKVVFAISKIKQFIGPLEPGAWKSTVNVGVIETPNKTPNKVPAQARAVLDIRFTEDMAETPEELVAKIKQLVPEVEVKALTHVSLLFVNEKNKDLQRFKEAAEKILGKPVPLAFEHGATDARYFAEVGIPAVVFGAIGGGMHATEEWVSIKSLEGNKRILFEFLCSI